MAPNIPIDINWASQAANVIYWLGYVVAGIVILGVMYLLSNYIRYQISVTEYPLHGSGEKGKFTVGKKKSNKVMWINSRTAWRPLYPLFNNKEIEPFDPEYIYPGNQITVFNLDGNWIPGEIAIDKSGAEIKVELKPVPYYIRNWQSLQHKKHAREFAKQDWWSENKMLVMAVITVAICCALGAATVWMTYKFAAPSADQISSLTQAISGIGNIPSKY